MNHWAKITKDKGKFASAQKACFIIMEISFNLLRLATLKISEGLGLIFFCWLLWLPQQLVAQAAEINMPEGSLPMLNFIQYGDSAKITQWNERRRQSEMQGMPLQILHIGDSHIQSGALSLVARKQLQQVFGYGGLGLTFPYAAAKTYTPRGHKTRFTGKFNFAKSFTLPPKLPLGLLGATVQTSDPTAKLRFLNLPPAPVNTKFMVEVWADGSDSMFQLQVWDGKVWKSMDAVQHSPFYTQEVATEGNRVLSDTTTDAVELVNAELPISTIFFEDWKVYRCVITASDSVVIRFQKLDEKQRQIEIYGVNIYAVSNLGADTGAKVAQPSGLLYHSVGMGGARFESLLYESLLPQQLQYLNPQLVILDFGTNDIAPLSVYPDKLREQIEMSVDIVQHALPNALVMLVTPMDMEFKGKKVVHTYPLAEEIKEIAQQKGCLLWNYYWITGAKGSLSRWQLDKKVSSDGIHMTEPGYWLKGNLLATSVLELLSSANTGNLPQQRWLNEDSVWLVWNGILSEKQRRNSNAVTLKPVAKPASIQTKKDGAGVASTSKSFPEKNQPVKTAAANIETAKNNPLISGPTNSNPVRNSPIKTSPFINPQAAVLPSKNQVSTASQERNKSKVVEKKMRHTVKPGEDIFDIAFEFGVTVAQIKKWNGLNSNNLQAGKVIVIVKSAPVGPRR